GLRLGLAGPGPVRGGGRGGGGGVAARRRRRGAHRVGGPGVGAGPDVPAALAGALRRVRRRGLRAGRRAARRQCALRERGRGRAARQRRRPVHGHLPTAPLTPDDGGRTTAGGGPPREGRAAGRGSGRGGTVVGQPSPRGGRESTIRLRAPTVSRVAALYSDSSGVPSGSAVSISAVQRSPYALGGSRKPTGSQWLLSSSRKESST